MTIQWYAMQSKPNKEDFLARQCEALGVEVFHPRIRVKVVNQRARKVRPYFPGYIFVQADLDQIGESALLWVPGSTGLVSFDGVPAVVSDGLIHTLQKQLEELNASEKALSSISGLNKGDLITIQDGPFAGHAAIFDASLSGAERVRVLLKWIGSQQLPLELPARQVQRIRKAEFLI